MGKPEDEEEGNAYATTEDWTMEEDGRDALSSSIQQHAANLKGEEGDIMFDDDRADVLPLASMNQSDRSLRSFNSLADQTGPRSGRNLSYASRSRSATNRSGTSTNPKSALKPKTRYLGIPYKDEARLSFSKPVYSTNQQARSGTHFRALIALICLGISICLAMFFGHGATGRWITGVLINSSGSASKEAPTHGGIPGAIGGTPAYNGTHEIPDLEAMNIFLPASIETGFADWRIPFPAGNRSDLPTFWQLPKGGGTVVQRILGQCLGLVEVSQEGADHEDPTLQILETPEGTRYLNVDATTAAGLQRAMDLQMVQSSLADVIFTPLIFQSAAIFTPEHRGRFFSVFRPPLERSMALYQAAKTTDAVVAAMSLADFATYKLPNNEMVRALASKGADEDLTDDDLLLSMEILRRKCVVGLTHRMPESMVRFHGYFGWYSLMVDGVSQCQTASLVSTANPVPAPQDGSDAYNIMMAQNRLDLRLYEYALYLFDVQGGTARSS